MKKKVKRFSKQINIYEKNTNIPVHEPDLNYEDYKSVLRTIKIGEISGSFTSTITKFEKEYAKFNKARYAVSVSNCTNALQLACRVIGIKKGDEVLVSSSTNIATALAIFYNGGIVVPIDSDPITWNLNEDLIERQITKNQSNYRSSFFRIAREYGKNNEISKKI